MRRCAEHDNWVATSKVKVTVKGTPLRFFDMTGLEIIFEIITPFDLDLY
jgi:hypothetical protein